VCVPPEVDRAIVHRVIYEELCLGRVLDESRAHYRRIIEGLAADGAQGIVLGCTEIAMLVDADDCAVPVFDTTTLHALAAAERAIGDR
jgi:aspartate racemase